MWQKVDDLIIDFKMKIRQNFWTIEGPCPRRAVRKYIFHAVFLKALWWTYRREKFRKISLQLFEQSDVEF